MLAIRMIKVLTIGLMLAALFAGAGGCQTIGPKASFDRGGATLESPSPVNLHIADNDKDGVASGVGPARWTSITGDEIQTLQSGSTPRDLWMKKLPDGTVQLQLSSGSDIAAKGVEYDPATGAFKVGEFSTSASEPLRAYADLTAALVPVFKGYTDDQLAQTQAWADTIKAVAPDLFSAITTAIKLATAGAAVP